MLVKKTAQILFTKEHLLHPIRLPLAKLGRAGTVKKLIDHLISATALAILGLLTAGIVPTLYLVGAYRKAKAINQTSAPREPNAFIKAMMNKKQTREEYCADRTVPTPLHTYRSSDHQHPKDLPWYMPTFAHETAGDRLFPKSSAEVRHSLCERRAKQFDELSRHPEIFFQRLSVNCDGHNVDVYIIAKKANLASGRWALFSNGHTGLAEGGTYATEFFDAVNANGVYFNYSGMGCSEGPTNRNAVVASYDAVLEFIEEKLDAKEIICWGTSMGGGVKGHAFKRHAFKNGKRYVAVSDQTYSTLANAAGSMVHTLANTAVKQGCWQLSSKTSSANLQHPEIVIHKAKKLKPAAIEDIEHDGLFGGEDSLAGRLLRQKSASEWPTKLFVGTTRDHCQGFNTAQRDAIITGINKALEPTFTAFA